MFTGIIQAKGEILENKDEGGQKQLTVLLPLTMVEHLIPGVSVAINGVCLTAVEIKGSIVKFDIMRETLNLTTLGSLQANNTVNVERSLRLGDELGGHFVSGHVHGTAKIVDIKKTGNNIDITFEPPAKLAKYIFPKGFITLNGVSLTVLGDSPLSGGQGGRWSVSLIPETLSRTTFANVTVGDLVNLEVDQQTRTIVDAINAISSPHRHMHNIAIVLGSFHKNEVTQMLVEARKTATELHLNIVEEVWVPGSVEKPLALKRLLLKPEIDGAVVLGIIEKGSTKHGFVMGQAVMDAVIQLQLEFMKPIGLGILGPDIEPHQIPPRLLPYARAAVEAAAKMLK